MSQRQEHKSNSHSDVKLFYDAEYYSGAISHSELPWHMSSIARRLGQMEGQAVLDVACGTGTWLAELKSRGAKVAGIDISSRAVEVCQKRLPDAEIREGVAEELPFDSGRFDLVTCLGSLEHFLDQRSALAEMRRVARHDARFLILVPNADFLTRRLGLYSGTQQTRIKETVRSISEWQELLASGGLQTIEIWRDLHPLSRSWISKAPVWHWPVRVAQALALTIWPVKWQYQVYFLCRPLPQGR